MVSATVNLQPDRETIFPYFELLYPDYQDYCLSVSRRRYALSIETCAYAWWLCVQLEARSVCDMGSGFSSYVLRRYAATVDYPVTVHSVDDNPVWMTKTVGYLQRHTFPTDTLFAPDVWLAVDDRYDVIVYDFAGGTARNDWMLTAVNHLTPTGVAVFDDAQNPVHHHRMGEVCIATGRTLLDVFHQTVDDVGRFATVGA